MDCPSSQPGPRVWAFGKARGDKWECRGSHHGRQICRQKSSVPVVVYICLAQGVAGFEGVVLLEEVRHCGCELKTPILATGSQDSLSSFQLKI